jgi:hypothetical protein
MAFRPNYNQARRDRERAKAQKKQEKLQKRQEAVEKRKAEQDDTLPSVADDSQTPSS